MNAMAPSGGPAGVEDRKTLLVVDDDATHCRAIARVLASKRDYDVVTCYSGAEALKVLKKTKPDLMLVDYAMPGMDGVELVKKVSAMGVAVPSIMVTGYPDVGELLQVQKAGYINHIIGKPWKPDHLLRVVGQVLSLHAMAAAVGELRSFRDTWTGLKR